MMLTTFNIKSKLNIVKKIRKILIVDDDDDARWGLSLFLKKEGYKVLEASDGLKAITMLNKESIDLVLSDLKMPNFDGIELLKFCNKNCENTTFVMMTAYGDCESFYEILNCGAFEYLNKPVKLEEVLSLIKRIEGK